MALMSLYRVKFARLVVCLCCVSCAPTEPEKEPLVLSQAGFDDLPGWKKDNHTAALAAFNRSCSRILKRDPQQMFGPGGVGGIYENWQPICRAALMLKNLDDEVIKAFFERWFVPWQARAGRTKKGLFTGYYEASLNGSRRRHGPYQTPLRRKPADLIMVNLGDFRQDLSGRRLAGRVVNGYLKPYEDRAAIMSGALPNDADLVLVWVDSLIDAFFLQIQGSGIVNFSDGSYIRVGYAGQNGHPYYAIGRELIKRGELAKDEVSMQSIRAWLEAHPEWATEIMNTNRSYVFFTELTGEGPLGGEGLALTPGRSLAVDRSKIPYGLPVWVDLDPPAAGEQQIRRLMVVQDTGGAIRGAIRGDVFWGHGSRAEYLAGQMKSEGRYWFLLPRTISR